jgi:hypothetical protein
MRSKNPREVGLIFREYARKIHAKALPTDPSFIRISVACGKVKHTIFFSPKILIIINRLNNGANTIIRLSSESTTKDLEAELNLSITLILAQVSSCKNNPVKSRSLLRGTGWPTEMGCITRTRRYSR